LSEGLGLAEVMYNRAYMYWSIPMDAITYTAARANLANTMDRVCQDHEPLIITRNGQQSVVMLSLEDYKSLEETAYLLRSPENAKRLLAAVDSLAKGKGKERQLLK
jgi:antitoxin YefM